VAWRLCFRKKCGSTLVRREKLHLNLVPTGKIKYNATK